MKREDVLKFENDIYELKSQNKEECITVIYYAVKALLKSLSFSIENGVDESLNIIKEYFKITKEENYYLSILIKNLSKIDEVALEDFLLSLDSVNKNTLEYYYGCIESIEDAIDMNREYRCIRPKKNFDTLIETDSYKKEICGLLLTEDDIHKFFNYEKEFLGYVNERKIYVDDLCWYGVYPKIIDNKVVDFNIMVPKVTSLTNAYIYVHELKHAYDMYNLIGKVYLDKDYELTARMCEDSFDTDYIKKIVLTKFKKH